MTSNDPINRPDHYCHGGIETIDVIKAKLSPEEFVGFLKGNIIKYTTRASFKGKIREDYRKAIWYINKLMEDMVIEGGDDARPV